MSYSSSTTYKSIYSLDELYLQLAEIREAKRAVIVGGQSYGVGRRNLTRASLAELNKEEQRILNEIEKLINPVGRVRRIVYWDQ